MISQGMCHHSLARGLISPLSGKPGPAAKTRDKSGKMQDFEPWGTTDVAIEAATSRLGEAPGSAKGGRQRVAD